MSRSTKGRVRMGLMYQRPEDWLSILRSYVREGEQRCGAHPRFHTQGDGACKVQQSRLRAFEKATTVRVWLEAWLWRPSN